jgi:hypothetical protein
MDISAVPHNPSFSANTKTVGMVFLLTTIGATYEEVNETIHHPSKHNSSLSCSQTLASAI